MLKESSRNAGSFLMVMIKKNDRNVRSNAEKTRTFGCKSCELQCSRT